MNLTAKQNNKKVIKMTRFQIFTVTQLHLVNPRLQQQCESNWNKSEVNESAMVAVNLPRWSRPLHPSSPRSPSPPPANSCTLPKTPSQLIRHCLLPSEPVHKGPPRSEPAFPLKLLHWWPPGMPIALGTGKDGWRWGAGGGSGKLDNRNSPIMLMCWGKPVKNWRATKGNAFHSQGSQALHPSTVPKPTLWNTQTSTHTHTHSHTYI